MVNSLLQLHALRGLSRDGWLLFVTRFIRLFAYGFLSVVLFLYLAQLGYSNSQIGLLLTLTLVGDTAVSLWLTTRADRIGRRRMLIAGGALMIMAGLVFALTRNFVVLVIAATIGVISPSGNEVGPFLAIEQASLSHVIDPRRRTAVFAWYALVGSLATALGSLTGGVLTQALQHSGLAALTSYRVVVVAYALLGLALVVLFTRVSAAIEVTPQEESSAAPSPVQAWLGLSHSHKIVMKLSGLFALDAFAGGFVIQSIAAYWFHLRFGADPAMLGGIFFGANLFAGLSALAAAWVAERFGLINTMVFTHLPSNVLLLLVPLMPNVHLAILVLLLRFSISQMDVPTRQSYTMAVVRPEERSAAAGITNVVRTTGASIAPLFAGILLGNPVLLGMPFYIAGSLKILYDLLLYRNFISIRPTEEQAVRNP